MFDGASLFAKQAGLLALLAVGLTWHYGLLVALAITIPPGWFALRLCNALERRDLFDRKYGRWP